MSDQLTDEKTKADEVNTQILETLELLGGKLVSEDDVTYEGTRFVIPAKMSAGDALKFLKRHVEAQEEVTAFDRVFQFRPWDGAYAFMRAVKKLTGTAGIGRATWSFFSGKNPPALRTIRVGHNKTTQVPWGQIEIPLFSTPDNKGVAELDFINTRDNGPVFRLVIYAARKYRHAAEGLFAMIQDELDKESIYRGKAIDAAEEPNFKDTSVIDPNKIVFSQQAIADLAAQLWWPIEDIDAIRSHPGLRVKRAVLLEGSYGTGKTETANITAKKCEAHGWTFIQVRANQDDIARAMTTAKLYQPAVVFFEDVDIIASADSATPGSISHLLDLFDGMDSKHTEIIAVLTTNHVDKIHKGMLRPGRLDGIIHLGDLDREGVEKLAHIQLGADRVKSVDFDQVFEAMNGYMPAFVNRAFAKAIEYSRGATILTTEDLVHAANGLRPQFELYAKANERRQPDTFAGIMQPMVQAAVDGAKLVDWDGDPFEGGVTIKAIDK